MCGKGEAALSYADFWLFEVRAFEAILTTEIRSEFEAILTTEIRSISAIVWQTLTSGDESHTGPGTASAVERGVPRCDIDCF